MGGVFPLKKPCYVFDPGVMQSLNKMRICFPRIIRTSSQDNRKCSTFKLSCQTTNRHICPHYCINDLYIKGFQIFENSTEIEEIANFENDPSEEDFQEKIGSEPSLGHGIPLGLLLLYQLYSTVLSLSFFRVI